MYTYIIYVYIINLVAFWRNLLLVFTITFSVAASSKISITFTTLHGVTSQQTVLFSHHNEKFKPSNKIYENIYEF